MRDPFVTEATVRTSDGLDIPCGVVGDLSIAPPVVLLHGLSQQRYFWGPVIRRLRHRPVIALDQRGHGVAGGTPDSDYAIDRCASDVTAVLDALDVGDAHVVGHSWGAAVALRLAAREPGRIRSVGLIDGGLWTRPTEMASRADVLERLRPPVLDIPVDELWARISQGDLAPTWNEEVRLALEPTFVVDEAGRATTRIGMARHMAVLDALLDYDPWPDAHAVGAPIWFALCQAPGEPPDERRQRTLERAAGLPTALVHRWEGAVHDVPLQWPALVAGFIDAMIESTAQRRPA